MRWILLLLVAANLALFGLWSRWFSNESEPQELEAQRLRVVPLERLGNPSAGGLRKAPVPAGDALAGASGAATASGGVPAAPAGAVPAGATAAPAVPAGASAGAPAGAPAGGQAPAPQ